MEFWKVEKAKAEKEIRDDRVRHALKELTTGGTSPHIFCERNANATALERFYEKQRDKQDFFDAVGRLIAYMADDLIKEQRTVKIDDANADMVRRLKWKIEELHNSVKDYDPHKVDPDYEDDDY